MNKIPIWNTSIPYNSKRNKYEDMVLSNRGNAMVFIQWIRWVFGRNLMKNNRGHDDYVDRYVIRKGLAKTTYEDIPTLTPYLVPGSKTSVVVAPGGGFCNNTGPGEGEYVANMLNRAGISAFVLTYRLQPYRYPVPCVDLQRAIRWIRSHSQEYGIPNDSIGAMGFSAGGYTVLGSAVLLGNDPVCDDGYIPDFVDAENGIPDYLISIYPLISFQNNPNLLANLIGPRCYTDPAFREQWQQKLEISDKLNTIADIPQFLAYGSKDSLAGLAEYSNRLKQEDICILPNAGHGFSGVKKYAEWETVCLRWINKKIINNE